ncbi:hypothetical protein BRADI_4g19372v3 [Brachypodium distachyon]|uniref:Uncharacterized protein n=1 Tax=Brachypodium distachyon TaxID=15368 RepID=A0A0Q3IQL1_BRADI|nr:hypothetical protein BRADI_4g19372v3 [Brachypodium distachyon]
MCSAHEAEEEAAYRMISSLQRRLAFEVDDVNWDERYLLQHARYNCTRELESVKEENTRLKQVITRITQGWKGTLQELRVLHEMANTTCCSAFNAYTTATSDIVSEVLRNMVVLEEQAERAVTEANAVFDESV